RRHPTHLSHCPGAPYFLANRTAPPHNHTLSYTTLFRSPQRVERPHLDRRTEDRSPRDRPRLLGEHELRRGSRRDIEDAARRPVQAGGRRREPVARARLVGGQIPERSEERRVGKECRSGWGRGAWREEEQHRNDA